MRTRSPTACRKQCDRSVVVKKSNPRHADCNMLCGIHSALHFFTTSQRQGTRKSASDSGRTTLQVALDKLTGETIWESTVGTEVDRRRFSITGSSAVVVSEACGIRQYVQMTWAGPIGVAAEDGRLLWQYEPFVSPAANGCLPIVRGDEVFCTEGPRGEGILLRIMREGEALKPAKAQHVPHVDGPPADAQGGGSWRRRCRLVAALVASPAPSGRPRTARQRGVGPPTRQSPIVGTWTPRGYPFHAMRPGC